MAASRSSDLALIEGGGILSADGSRIEPADVLLAGDRIDSVGPSVPRPGTAVVIDARGCLVVPGLINAHVHSHNNLSRGLVGEWTLEDFLNHGPALLAARTPDELRVSALLGAVEMLKSGCTTAYDLTTAIPGPTADAMDAVIDGYAASGIRVTLAPMMVDRPFLHTIPGLLDLLPDELRSSVARLAAAPAAGLLSMVKDVFERRHGTLGGRIQIAIAPSIPAGCTDEFLAGCVRLQNELGIGLHTHLDESKVEAVQGRRRWGTTTTARLAAIGALGPRFTAAHAIWLTADDLSLLASSGASIAHNPASNLRLGNGIAPIRDALDAGINVGLGTDGSAASDTLDMYTAMRFAAMVSRIRFPYQQARWLGWHEMFPMATERGAHLLGSKALGVLQAGAKADLALINLDSISLAPLNHAANALVFRDAGRCVETVLVDGQVVVSDGKVVGVDERRLRQEAETMAESIRARNPDWWRLATAVTPYLGTACGRLAAEDIGIDRFAG
jgi:5-methylthioadenosine/S-adenosylhomocysteine deaminase